MWPPTGGGNPSPGQAGDPAGSISPIKVQAFGINAPYCDLVQRPLNFVIHWVPYKVSLVFFWLSGIAEGFF